MNAIYKKHTSKPFIVRWSNADSLQGIIINNGGETTKEGSIWPWSIENTHILQDIETIEDWLHALPTDCREKALSNYKLQNKEQASRQASNLGAALTGGFVWDKSPEGHKYWENIRNQIWEEDDGGFPRKGDESPLNPLTVESEDKQQNKKEMEYPIYAKSKSSGIIVKFVGLESGTVVDPGNHPTRKKGEACHSWCEHTEEINWTTLPDYVEESEDKKENMQKLPEKFYIKVSKPEFSQAIQAQLFEFGYKWAGGTRTVITGDYITFICVNKEEITWQAESQADSCSGQEITMGELFMTPLPPKIEELTFKAGEFMDDYELRVGKNEITVNDADEGDTLYTFTKEEWKNYREKIHKSLQPDERVLGRWSLRIAPKTISIGCQDIPYEKWVDVMAKINSFQGS